MHKPVDGDILGGTDQLANELRNLANRIVDRGLVTDEVYVEDGCLLDSRSRGSIDRNTGVGSGQGVGVSHANHVVEKLPGERDRTRERELVDVRRVRLLHDSGHTSCQITRLAPDCDLIASFFKVGNDNRTFALGKDLVCALTSEEPVLTLG